MITEFINWVSGMMVDIHAFFTDGVPYIVSRTLAYVVEIGLYVKIEGELMMIQIGYSIAQQILQDFNISGILQPLMSSLPSSIQWFLFQSGAVDGVNMILHAIVTRFSLSFLGW